MQVITKDKFVIHFLIRTQIYLNHKMDFNHKIEWGLLHHSRNISTLFIIHLLIQFNKKQLSDRRFKGIRINYKERISNMDNKIKIYKELISNMDNKVMFHNSNKLNTIHKVINIKWMEAHTLLMPIINNNPNNKHK